MPLATESIDLGSRYDLIISDTAGFAKGIRYHGKTKHLSYIHTPLRYAWETKTYFPRGEGFKNFFIRFFGASAFAYLRYWDRLAAQRPDVLLANSQYIRSKVEMYYGRSASVLYPPVDTTRFYRPNTTPGGYYLAVGRLLHYKRFDLIIKAFIVLGKPLKIVGAGDKEVELKKIAASAKNIDFLPFQKSDEQLRALYAGAKAFIMANEEDFGLVMAEAQACGTPVIAYHAGGATEIVSDGQNGTLFTEQTPESLIAAVHRFETLRFDPTQIVSSAQRFTKEHFVAGIRQAVGELLK
jgi:glycosyltransferase involved in cell wall biosynthesis